MRRARPGAVGTRVAAVAVALLLLGGCASTQTLKRADAYAQNGEWDAAITYYQQRLQEDPGDQEARRKLLLAKTASAAYHRAEGNKLFEAGDLQRAQMELELAVRLDPGNQAAVLDLQRVNRAIAEAAKRAAATPTEIQRAILRLSPKMRAITVLRYVEGLSYDEIAEALQISLGTVKSRLARAHRALDRELTPVLDRHYLR